MTDNEIIKAWELCFTPKGTTYTCAKCPYHKFGALCKEKRNRDTIDLLNRLKAENEALISAQETLQKHIEKQSAEIERVQTATEEMVGEDQ